VPNLPNRYEYSQRKDADEERPEVTVVHVKSEKVKCLGECGEMVAPGHKCVACATAAVEEWRRNKNERDKLPQVRRGSSSKPNRRRRS